MVGHKGSSADSYLADPTSPISSHWAVIILFASVPVHQLLCLALKELTPTCAHKLKPHCIYAAQSLLLEGGRVARKVTRPLPPKP